MHTNMVLVPRRGLEPPRPKAHGPEPCASTNSAIWARHWEDGVTNGAQAPRQWQPSFATHLPEKISPSLNRIVTTSGWSKRIQPIHIFRGKVFPARTSGPLINVDSCHDICRLFGSQCAAVFHLPDRRLEQPPPRSFYLYAMLFNITLRALVENSLCAS